MIHPNSTNSDAATRFPARFPGAPGASEAPARRSLAFDVSRAAWATLAAAAVLLALPFAAQATNGVVEINHTCAVQTGCFAGDSAGYPITISGGVGRSYRLTSDLIVPDENTSGIVISTSDLGIDLNNFTIIRSGCEGATTDCTPASGTGSGIARILSTNRGISVKNGSITGMGSYGIRLGEQADVTGLRVRWNRLGGILANNGSIISGSAAYQNGGNGIHVFSGSTVSGNTAYENAFDGIFASTGSTVSGNTAFQNGDDGIFANSGSTVSGNTAYNNTDDGISVSSGVTVSGNTAYANGGDGILAGSGSTVRRNSVRLNGGYGLNLGSQAAYGENVITSNTTGSVRGGVNRNDNYCQGSFVVSSFCP